MSARHDGIRVRRKEVRRLSHAGWSRPAIAEALGCTVAKVQHDRVATRSRKRAPAKWRDPGRTAKRRKEVRRLTDAGWSRPEIAQELGCTVNQVQHHRVATKARVRMPAR